MQAPPFPGDEFHLGAQVERGLRWSALSELITGLVGTLGALAYTRMLQPEDLGAFGLAMLIYTGLYLLVEAPIRDAVVYFQDGSAAPGGLASENAALKSARRDSAAFWLLVGFSAVAVSLVLAFAPLLSFWYDSPSAAGLARLLAVAFLLRALAVVPAARLLKDFRFALRQGLYMVFSLILFIGWVALAALGLGPWSLAIPVLGASAFWALAIWLAAGFRPALKPGWAAFQDVLRYSRSLFGSKLITYIKGYIDNAAVGRLGERALGWYSLGEDQSSFAVISVGMTIATIALPVLARVRYRLDEFRRIYLELMRLAASLSTPMQVGALVLADLGVRTIFGEHWLGAVPVLRAYLAFRLVDTLQMINMAATSAIGRPDVQFKVDLAQLPFFVLGIWVGMSFPGGIVAVAWSLALVRILAGLAYFAALARVTGLAFVDFRRYLSPSSLAGGIMGGCVYLLRKSAPIQRLEYAIPQPFLADVSVLFVLVLSGVICYVLLLFVLDPPGSKAVLRMGWRILIPEGGRQRLEAIWAARWFARR